MEHEAQMQAFRPDELLLEDLDNPGWDPLCFASNEAMAYFMPGLVRVVLTNTADYIQQFVFHIGQPERLSGFSPRQARALIGALDLLLLHEVEAVENNLAVDELFRTRDKLGEIAE